MTATEVLPQPQAVDASVWVDAVMRTLTVRLPDKASGYERHLWAQSWQALRRGQENGWPPGSAMPVWADLPGARRVVPGQPGEGGTLVFTFPPGARGFAELISRPGVFAITTVDRSRLEFSTCRFLRRAAAG